MNRRWWAVAALALVVAAPVAGYTAAVERTAYWQQQLCDAQTAMDANTASLGAVAVTAQDPRTLQRNYLAAAARFNQATAHLHLNPNDSTECTP